MPFFRDDPVTTLLAWALLAALLDALLRLARRSAPPETPASQGGLIFFDLAVLIGLGVWGVGEASRLHELANPAWTPLGQGSPEVLATLAAAATGVEVPGLGDRYPLYPTLSVAYGAWSGRSPAEAGLAVSTTAIGLLPAALYHLGVQLAPRGVALAMAPLSLVSPLLTGLLGQPTDHTLCALLQVSACAWGLSWARRPEPHAALGLGVALALLGLTTPHALLALLALLIGAVVLAPWRRPGWALLCLTMLLSPLVGAWTVMGRLKADGQTLERAVFVVERAYAAQHGVTLTAADYGLSAEADQERGYRFGDDAALRHLPETVRFFTTRPAAYPPLSTRLPEHKAGLVEDLGVSRLPEALWIPLFVVGALGAARGVPLWRGLGAAACLFAVVGGGMIGAPRVDYASRYASPSLVALPVVWAAGATAAVSVIGPILARALGWSLPSRPSVLAFGLGLLSVGFVLERPEAPLVAEAARRAAHPVSALVRLRDELRPDDVVVDATPSREATAMFWGRARIERAEVPTTGPPVTYGAEVGGARRFVVVGCALTPCQEPAWRMALHQTDASPRMRRLGEGLWEDTEPTAPGRVPPLTPAPSPATAPPGAGATPATPPASPPPGP